MKEFSSVAAIESFAIKSQCGKHRFVLGRIWNRSLPINAFLCANPSKADELRYDTTVFKCGNIAVNWKWGGFYILNLNSYYSTNPAGLVHDPHADKLNEEHVARVIRDVNLVVIACGNGHGEKLDQLIQGVPRNKLYCLGRNKGGGFLHPSRKEPDDFPSPIQAYPAEA
jgi:hypothetical protein